MGERDHDPAADRFSFRALQDGMVHIAYQGNGISALAGENAPRLLARAEGTVVDLVQLDTARATDYFKRGFERCST